ALPPRRRRPGTRKSPDRPATNNPPGADPGRVFSWFGAVSPSGGPGGVGPGNGHGPLVGGALANPVDVGADVGVRLESGAAEARQGGEGKEVDQVGGGELRARQVSAPGKAGLHLGELPPLALRGKPIGTLHGGIRRVGVAQE